MQTNQSLLNSKLTHIMGRAGTGKTYFVKNQIEEIIKNNKNVIYLSAFDDIVVDSNLLEKVYIENEDDIKNTYIENKNLHIVFDRRKIGEDEAIKLANKFMLSKIESGKLSEKTYLILDDCQKYEDDIFNKIINSSVNVVLIHQYIEQLNDDTQFLVFNHCEKGIYFNMAKSNIDTLKLYYKEDVKEIDTISNLDVYEYIILSKKDIDDKKQVKKVIDLYFDAFNKKDVEKLQSVCSDTVNYIYSEDHNFDKEMFGINFDKIKFEGENNITHISINEDWAYVHLTGQMILGNQEKVSDKMMITLRKNDSGWMISCVQNMQ